MITVIVRLDNANMIGSEEIEVLRIWNNNTGTPESGNYEFAITNSERDIYGNVKDFHRTEEDVWSLILEVLKKIKGK